MKKDENVIPDEYWSSLSDSEKEAMAKAMEEADQFIMNEHEWQEMDDAYYAHLRERFNKGADEIGPRNFKTYLSKGIPFWMMVIPAGKQALSENPDVSVQHFHTICEDMELGECNGAYELITEEQLESKFNIKYNN